MTLSAVFVVPGSLDALTGGYIYNRRMIGGLRGRGWDVGAIELAGRFPHPSPREVAHAAEALASVPLAATLVVDSLALGAMPDVIVGEAARRRVAALVHLPLAADPAVEPRAARAFEDAERRALAAAALVIVTGTAGRDLLAPYDLTPDRVAVVEPGTDRAPLARGSGKGEASLLCVAALTPGKGHDTLLEALAAVRGDGWHLTCAGSLTRDPATVGRVRALVARLGLEARVSLRGELDGDALAAAYDAADMFVLASRRETYGMAAAEALARGIPVVATATGAIPRLVGETAGIVVPVGDTPALTAALTRAIADRRSRGTLAAGARSARERLPTWEEASARMADVLGRRD